MSVRHQMRAKVEELFKMMIDNPEFPKDNEVTVYAVFVPQEGDFEEEDIEVCEQRVAPENKEIVKKFLERTTREALEADVKGLKLYGYVFEDGDDLKIVTKENEDFKDLIISRIERMREEV